MDNSDPLDPTPPALRSNLTRAERDALRADAAWVARVDPSPDVVRTMVALRLLAEGHPRREVLRAVGIAPRRNGLRHVGQRLRDIVREGFRLAGIVLDVVKRALKPIAGFVIVGGWVLLLIIFAAGGPR